MANLLIRCARTGLNVQLWLPDQPPGDEADSYEAISCPACAQIHLVNKATGRMLGDKEK
jgi:hypothetical protein